MKTKFIAVCFLLFTIAPTASARVLVIAMGANTSVDKAAKPLEYAVSDAEEFAAAMAKVGAIPERDIMKFANPRISEFKDALQRIKEGAKKSSEQALSKIIVFFSGHADERGLHFKDGFFEKKGLQDLMASLGARTSVVIIDSCFAGLLSNKGIRPTTGFGMPKLDFDEPSGSVYLTAASSQDLAFKSRRLKGGLFSKAVITGLYGKADSNGDGIVTATELYEYAYRLSGDAAFKLLLAHACNSKATNHSRRSRTGRHCHVVSVAKQRQDSHNTGCSWKRSRRFHDRYRCLSATGLTDGNDWPSYYSACRQLQNVCRRGKTSWQC